MKKRNVVLLATVAAAGVYSAINGKGIFNKVRFREQHDAISRYVDAHYKNAVYTPIEQAGDGWATVIIRQRKPKILLYVMRAENGMYIFNETVAENS